MEIVLMNNNAIIPTRASKRSAGLELYSSIDARKINTEICVSLPENSYGSIKDKSSLAAKGLLKLGGVIDNDYTGEIIITMTSLIEPIKINQGQKIAQLIVSNLIYTEIKLVLNEMIKDLVKWILIINKIYSILFDLIIPTNPFKYYLI